MCGDENAVRPSRTGGDGERERHDEKATQGLLANRHSG